jgi:hypothetical protein
VRRLGFAAIACAVALATAATASAQIVASRDRPRAGTWEIGGGGIWSSGFSGPRQTAELTQNGGSSGGFDLFTASGEVGSGAGLGASLGYYLSPSLALEAGLRFSKPRLSYRLTGDVENAPTVTAEETLTRYVFTGSFVFHLGTMHPRRQLVPFVAAGAGYIRDLHEGAELVETGTEYHVSGGIKYWLGSGARRLGIRGEAGVAITDGGFDFRDSTRTVPLAAGSIVLLF